MYSPLSARRYKSISTVIAFAIFALLGSALARAGTVDIYPGADIPTVVNSSPAGTTFTIHAGLYRLQTPINPKTGDVFTGPCGKPPCASSSQAVVSGSHLLTSFNQSGGYYFAGGQTQQKQVTISSTDCKIGRAH